MGLEDKSRQDSNDDGVFDLLKNLFRSSSIFSYQCSHTALDRQLLKLPGWLSLQSLLQLVWRHYQGWCPSSWSQWWLPPWECLWKISLSLSGYGWMKGSYGPDVIWSLITWDYSKQRKLIITQRSKQPHYNTIHSIWQKINDFASPVMSACWVTRFGGQDQSLCSVVS